MQLTKTPVLYIPVNMCTDSNIAMLGTTIITHPSMLMANTTQHTLVVVVPHQKRRSSCARANFPSSKAEKSIHGHDFQHHLGQLY